MRVISGLNEGASTAAALIRARTLSPYVLSLVVLLAQILYVEPDICCVCCVCCAYTIHLPSGETLLEAGDDGLKANGLISVPLWFIFDMYGEEPSSVKEIVPPFLAIEGCDLFAFIVEGVN